MMNNDKSLQLYINIGKLITSSLDFEKIIEGIMDELNLFFSPDNCSILRLDQNTDELFFVAVKGISLDNLKDIKLKVGEGVAGIVAQTGESMYIEDTAHNEFFSKKIDKISGFHTKSIIAVPIKFRDKIFGVIEIINQQNSSNNKENFSKADSIILESIADFAAIAFANASQS